MDLRKLKDQASEAFGKGRFARAAELWSQYSAADPRDHQARLRTGDAWAKAGARERAVESYQAAARGFAAEGFLPRAIAASKLVLELEPAHRDVQRMLADLYAARGTPADARAQRLAAAAPAAPGEVTPAPPAATESPGAEVPRPDPVTPSVVPPSPVAIAAPDAEVPRAVPMSASAAVPPGLRPRRSSTVADLAPASPSADLLDPEMPPGGFTELELESTDSLLHLVEGAARAGGGARQHPEEDEEPFFSLTEQLISEEPAPGTLPHIPLFSDLPSEAFIALFERCPLRRFASGARILEQGSVGTAFFVVCEGQVRVLREEGGVERELALLQEGAFFGEMALLSGAPRTASVESASEDTQLLEISAEVLTALSREYPQVARALKKFCRDRMLLNVMSSAALFRLFDRRDRRELIERFRAREVRRGDRLVREGERSDGLYVVLSGEVAVRTGEQQLALLREGELFGEMSLLDKAPATADVIATRRTSLLRLPREAFDALISSHPQILAHVAELTDGRRRHTETVLV